MGFDDALGQILALEARWRGRCGLVRLSDLGIGPHLAMRSRGRAEPVPQRWRRYPGARPLLHERLQGA